MFSFVRADVSQACELPWVHRQLWARRGPRGDVSRSVLWRRQEGGKGRKTWVKENVKHISMQCRMCVGTGGQFGEAAVRLRSSHHGLQSQFVLRTGTSCWDKCIDVRWDPMHESGLHNISPTTLPNPTDLHPHCLYLSTPGTLTQLSQPRGSQSPALPPSTPLCRNAA